MFPHGWRVPALRGPSDGIRNTRNTRVWHIPARCIPLHARPFENHPSCILGAFSAFLGHFGGVYRQKVTIFSRITHCFCFSGQAGAEQALRESSSTRLVILEVTYIYIHMCIYIYIYIYVYIYIYGVLTRIVCGSGVASSNRLGILEAHPNPLNYPPELN